MVICSDQRRCYNSLSPGFRDYFFTAFYWYGPLRDIYLGRSYPEGVILAAKTTASPAPTQVAASCSSLIQYNQIDFRTVVTGWCIAVSPSGSREPSTRTASLRGVWHHTRRCQVEIQ